MPKSWRRRRRASPRIPHCAASSCGPDGTPLQAGDRLIQADLARTLAQIAVKGPDYFYHGPVAASVAQASRAAGGIITAADLASYRVGIDKPLQCSYRGYDVVSVAPPSSGGVVLCEILNILEVMTSRRWAFIPPRRPA